MNTPLPAINIDTITLGTALSIFGCAVGLSLLLSVIYYITRHREGIEKSVITTIVVLAPICSLIILIVGSNLARAIGIGGGIALIRYRSTFDSPMDLTYAYSALAIGMACGIGFVGLAAIFTLIMCVILLAIWLIGLKSGKSVQMKLKVLIPEDIDFYGFLDDTLQKFCKNWRQEKIKTVEYGTLLEVSYKIKIKNIDNQKEFIDEIRAKNGNLNVILTQYTTEEL